MTDKRIYKYSATELAACFFGVLLLALMIRNSELAIKYVKDGKLYTAFHIHTNYDAPSGDRRACITEAYFDENGEFKIKPQ